MNPRLRVVASPPVRDPYDRDAVWLARGLTRQWRIVGPSLSYGEWDELDDAQEFLRLLLLGNPKLHLLHDERHSVHVRHLENA